jgi:hypothetical protein
LDLTNQSGFPLSKSAFAKGTYGGNFETPSFPPPFLLSLLDGASKQTIKQSSKQAGRVWCLPLFLFLVEVHILIGSYTVGSSRIFSITLLAPSQGAVFFKVIPFKERKAMAIFD